jgi:putative ABC transport system permease protein
VAGVYNDKGHLLSDITVANDQLQRDFGAGKDNYIFVGATGGDTTKAAIKRVLKDDFPQTEALSNKEFIDDQAGQIDQLLGLIYALLALAIIVSLFGIVNTLVLSITERTRELGMLRAIGTSRRQVRRMIRYEAVITALLGGILGAGLGVLLAVVVSRPLDDFKLAIPVPSLIVLLILSALAGVGAAVLPARRAAKLDVLEALAYE